MRRLLAGLVAATLIALTAFGLAAYYWTVNPWGSVAVAACGIGGWCLVTDTVVRGLRALGRLGR